MTADLPPHAVWPERRGHATRCRCICGWVGPLRYAAVEAWADASGHCAGEVVI